MKLPIPIPHLTPAEIATLKRVAINSAVIALIIVGIVWLIRFRAVKTAEKHAPPPANADISAVLSSAGPEISDLDINAHRLALDVYIKTDQPEKAIKHILRILPLSKAKEKKELLLKLATEYMEAGRCEQALSVFEKLSDFDMEKDSLSPLIAARRGLALFYFGKIESSRDELTQCIAQYPNDPEACCYLGEVEAAIKTPSPEAERFFQEAIDKNPLYAEARYQQARYYMTLKEYPRALDSLQQILLLEPLYEKAHSRLGMAYYYLNMPSLALKSYETALALNADDFNVHYNLGELYYTLYSNMELALKEFKKTIELQPDHAEANFKIGLICLANNMNKEAVKYLETAVTNSPKNIRFMLQLAVAYEKLDLKDNALQVYLRVAELAPLDQIAQQKIKLLSADSG
jgi:tetratricopeptide (TPR) repeat protein